MCRMHRFHYATVLSIQNKPVETAAPKDLT